MIKIKISRKNDKLNKIIISGHSGYDELGKDIVCASVSSIAITSINLALSIDKEKLDYQESEGYLAIEILDEELVYIFDNMLLMLKELANEYPKNIEIKE